MTGIAEPEYGREAIHPATDGLEGKQVYTILEKVDNEWVKPESTNVETQTFYFNCFETGYMGFVQVIHSDMVGFYSTAQQTFKMFHKDSPEEYVWTSTKLDHFQIEGANFYADGLKIELSEDGKTYHFQSDVCHETIIDLTFERLVDAVKFGKNGTTYYGDDLAEPWGCMKHVFWPRNKVFGSVILNEKEQEPVEEGEEVVEVETKPKLDPITRSINGRSMFVMALQGMKPHHAAAAWNFLNFNSNTHSVVVMEFTTPKSYDTTKVSVAIVSTDDKIISCCIDNDIKQLDAKTDEVGWPVPQKLECVMSGYECSSDLAEKLESSPDSVSVVKTVVKGDLDHLSERVDVMAEIPGFIKNIVSGVVGTKPYIYQFCNKMTIDISGSQDDDVVGEEGVGYSEATFISYI